MSKHTISYNSYNKLAIDLGDKIIYLRHDSKLDSISIDCTREGTTICLSGSINKNINVCVFTVKDYSFKELAELIFDLINIKRPEKLYLERIGLSIGINDYLIPQLIKNKIILSKSGSLVYDLNEEYLINNSFNMR